MQYTLKQLRYIDIAARHASISRASSELNISPSSISTAIQFIEKNANEPLFNRLPSKGISPTEFGKLFLHEARKLLKASWDFEETIKEQTQATTRSVRMGWYTPAASIVFPLVETTLKKIHSNIIISYTEGDAQSLYESLIEGEIDIAFCYRSDPLPENLRFIPLLAAPPYVILPADHPLAKQHSVSLQDIYNEPMILLNLPNTKDYMHSLFTRENIAPRISHFSESADIVRSMVAAGSGYSILNLRPMPDGKQIHSNLVCVPLSGRHQIVHYGLLLRSNSTLGQIDQNMIDLCLGLKDEGIFEKLTVTA